MILRPYQERVLDELWAWFARHDDGNPIVSASVGAGKSLMIAAAVKRVCTEAPGARVQVIVHQHELLEQNLSKLLAIWPQADVGVCTGGASRKQLDRQIVYATIGSIYKRAYEVGRVDFVQADECHLINPKEMGMWRSYLAALARTCPHTRVCGWTGTPFRGNGVWLTAGEDALFTHIATSITMRELLDTGFLAPLRSVATEAVIQTEGVRKAAGDFVVSDLATAANKPALVMQTCKEIVSLAEGRRRWLVFCVNIEHAQACRDELKRLGVAAEMVTGLTPKGERDAIIKAFRRGHLKCLVNVAVLTTGFDVPEVDFIALLRPTESPLLYVQIAGRGMRLAPGKDDCLWADFTSTTKWMGPVDGIKGREPVKKMSAEAPFRVCPSCGSRNHASALSCVDCGFQFPPPDRIRHDTQANGDPVLSTELETRQPTFEVSAVDYKLHTKPGSPNSMLVCYFSGASIVAREWVCLDHEGYVRLKAESWWRRRAVDGGTPVDVAEALQLARRPGHLKTPKAIQVDMSKKNPEIIYYDWSN